MHFKGFFNKGVFFKWNQCSWILVSSTRMTWTWLSACAGKALSFIRDARNAKHAGQRCVADSDIPSPSVSARRPLLSETGRSMIEMLGVLAIIGVLSIAAVVGYRFALLKFRANEVVNELNMRAVDISAQIAASGKTYALEEELPTAFDTHLDMGYETYSYITALNNDYFRIDVFDVPADLCRQILNDYDALIAIFVGDHETDEDTRYTDDLSVCNTSSNLTNMGFVYKNDLNNPNCGWRAEFNIDELACHCSGNTYLNMDTNECFCPAGHIWSEQENTCIESICDEGYFESTQYGCIPCGDTRAVTVTTTRQQRSCNACPNRHHDVNYGYCINDTQCTQGEQVATQWGGCNSCSLTSAIYIGNPLTNAKTKEACQACAAPNEREIVDNVCVPKGKATGTNGLFWYWTQGGTITTASCNTPSALNVRSSSESGEICALCVNADGVKNRKVVDSYCVKTVCDADEFMGADGACYACSEAKKIKVNANENVCASTACGREKVTENDVTYCRIKNCPKGTHVLLDDGSCYPCSLNDNAAFYTDSTAEKELCAACEGADARHVTGNNKCILNRRATKGKSFYYLGGVNWSIAPCAFAGGPSISSGTVEHEYCLACTDRYIDSNYCHIDNKSCSTDQFSARSKCYDCSLTEKVRVDTVYQRNSCLSCSSESRFWAGNYCYRCDAADEPDVITEEEKDSCLTCTGLRIVSDEGKCVLVQ